MLAVLKGSKAVSWAGDEATIADKNNDHQRPTRKRSESNRARGLPQHHLLKRSGGPASTMNQTLNPSIMASANNELSLYQLDDETGVMVITSFAPEDSYSPAAAAGVDEEAVFINKFVSLATEAISYLHQRGLTKIIIDLSGNGGGFTTLGENLAMQFFPKANHFFGTNMRWNPALATMLTKGADPNTTYWDLGHYRKLDGTDFASYQEFLGPVPKDDDYFTVIAIPDVVETNAEDGANLPSSYSGPQPFETEDIVLVSF